VSKRNAVLIVLGMTFYWPTFRAHHFGVIFPRYSNQVLSGETAYLALLILIMLLSIATALRPASVSQIFSSHPQVVPILSGATTLITLGTMLFSESSNWIGTVIAALSIPIFASYVLIITIVWGMTLATSKRPGTMTCLAFSLFASFLVSLAIQLPEPFEYILPLISPLFCGLTWYLLNTKHRAAKEAQPLSVAVPKIAAIPTAVFILILFMLVGAIIRGLSATGILYYPTHEFIRQPISIILSFVLAILVYFSSRNERLTSAFWIVFAVLFFAGLFVAALFNSALWQIGSDIVVISRSFLIFFLWTILLLETHENRRNPVFLLSTYFLIVDCVSGLLTNYLIPAIMGGVDTMPQELIGIMALSMAFILLVGSFIYFSSLAFRRTTTHGSDWNPNNARREVCASLATQHQLTAREAEVLYLISQGHSIRRIAGDLCISISTAQTHAKSLYRKVDVHSKQEIIDFVDNALIPK
jgi:DNA-binding CsgD family transcriptional regulator